MGDNNAGSKASFFLVGLGIGAMVGLLFAPKSGEDTRDYLSGKADEGRDYAQRKARELRERAEDLIERSKEIMARQKDGLSAAVEAGKETYKRESKVSWLFWFGPAVHKGDVDVRLDPSIHRHSSGRHRDSDGDPAGHVLSGADCD